MRSARPLQAIRTLSFCFLGRILCVSSGSGNDPGLVRSTHLREITSKSRAGSRVRRLEPSIRSQPCCRISCVTSKPRGLWIEFGSPNTGPLRRCCRSAATNCVSWRPTRLQERFSLKQPIQPPSPSGRVCRSYLLIEEPKMNEEALFQTTLSRAAPRNAMPSSKQALRRSAGPP